MGSTLLRLPVKLVPWEKKKNTALISSPPSRPDLESPEVKLLRSPGMGLGGECPRHLGREYRKEWLGHLLSLHPQEMTWAHDRRQLFSGGESCR